MAPTFAPFRDPPRSRSAADPSAHRRFAAKRREPGKHMRTHGLREVPRKHSRPLPDVSGAPLPTSSRHPLPTTRNGETRGDEWDRKHIR